MDIRYASASAVSCNIELMTGIKAQSIVFAKDASGKQEALSAQQKLVDGLGQTHLCRRLAGTDPTGRCRPHYLQSTNRLITFTVLGTCYMSQQ